MSERRTEYISIDELVPAALNPKQHDIPELIKSFQRWGFTVPILVCERKGQVAAGNGRHEALVTMRGAGMAPPDGVTVDWKVPTISGWSSRNDDEFNSYLAADNQHTIKGGWDNKLLYDLLNSGDDLEGTGFTLEDLDELAKSNARLADDLEKDNPGGVNFDVTVECDSSVHRQEVIAFLETEGLKVKK